MVVMMPATFFSSSTADRAQGAPALVAAQIQSAHAIRHEWAARYPRSCHCVNWAERHPDDVQRVRMVPVLLAVR